MVIPESLLILAGFALAHALWSVSDLPEGDLLVPLAIVEKSGQRQLHRFVAETQEESIEQGKAILKQHENDLDAWAFAREGQMQLSGTYFDVITVEAKATGMANSVSFVQRFQPFSKGRFMLLGEPIAIVAGKEVTGAEAKQLIIQLHAGILSHSKAAEL